VAVGDAVAAARAGGGEGDGAGSAAMIDAPTSARPAALRSSGAER
jgi:hypothetical protein